VLAAYTIMEFHSGAFAASLAFTLPAFAADLTVAFLIFRVFRHAPLATDESWPAFFGALLGTHLFILVRLAGIPLIAPHPQPVLQNICMILLAASYPLVVLTLLVLGSSWSVLPEAKKLVTSGPYKWSRHPLYALYLFWYLMLVGVGQTWTVVVVALASAGLQIYRANCEERVLLAAFGDEYEEYCKATGWFGRRSAS
jgi:protein-S-isoprenylcysteine O-methyltransferase Ste14